MKMKMIVISALGLVLTASSMCAATLTWTNVAGGDWNDANNWSPNQVPASGDNVIITQGGTYTVTDSGSATLGNLTLGGASGIQTLTIASLTVTNASTVNSGGVLNWSGGNLNSALTVAQGGTLTISNTVYFGDSYYNTFTLTNYGTVIWAGNITSYAGVSGQGGAAIIDNAGLWESVGDNTMSLVNGNCNGLFINTGTLEKTGGTGTTTINWNFDNEGGTVTTPSGAFSMGNWTGNGLVHGNATFSGGTIAGTLASDAVMTFSATINGSMTVSSNAVANWNGGDLEGALTVAQGGTLSISNTVYFDENYFANTALTNYGTVVWAGHIVSFANYNGSGGIAVIDNAGLWESVADNSMSLYNGNCNGLFINTGTLEKIGGTGTSTIWSFDNEGGTISTPTGSFSMGNWTGNGLVYGNATFSGGTISGTVAPGAMMTFSATINGAMTVSSNAVANWNGGDLESSLTVLQGGTLSISNTVYFDENYFANTALTNYGTVVWAGNIVSFANYNGSGGIAVIDNAGLWESVADNTIQLYSYNGSATGLFINTGTLEKIGGTGTSTIGWNFDNEGGTVTTPTGSFSMGNWTGNGLVYGNATFSGGTISGTVAPGAMMTFSATIYGSMAVSSNAVANWNGGDLEGALTVAQGGTLSISNSVSFDGSSYNNTVTLTNYGTVVWAGNIVSFANYNGSGGIAVIDNAGLWESVADNTIQLYSYNGSATGLFINTGTLEKIGGTGTSTIAWNFINNGGTINTPVGSFSMGDWIGSGLVYGNATFSSGTISGTVAPGAMMTFSATIYGSMTVSSNAVANWNGGDLEGALTVAQGGTLSISNAVYFDQSSPYTNTATLTNYGTVVFGEGNITSLANFTGQGGQGGAAIIDNAGLWESVADNIIQINNHYGFTMGLFINTGTLEKTGGTGTSTINWNFLNNGGILGSQTNTLSLAGNYDLTGGTLNVGINSLGNYGIINLSGSPAALTGSVSANLNNGYVPATGSSFPVLTYGSESGVFANFLPPYAVAMQTNYGGTVFTLTVLNVRPTLAAISDQTVDELKALNVTASATDPDIGQTLTFALVSSPGGMSINPTTGAISWTPAQTQSPSTNTVLVSVTDNGIPPLSATNSFSVVVKEVNVAPVLAVIAQTNVNAQALLTVTNAATESNIHATVGYFLLSAPSSAQINSTGIITWTPLRSQGPSTNIITAVATNADIYDLTNTYLSATNSFTVIVYAPTLAPIGNFTVNPGQTVAFNASAKDNDSTRTLTFSLIAPPSGAGIGSSSGVFNWRLAVAQANTTNTVQVQVTDNSTPALTDTKSFTVTVNPLAPVVLTPKGYANSQFKFQVNGTTGPDYIITASTNLLGWSDIFTNLSPSTPFEFTNSMTSTSRFFRARLSP